MGKEAEVSRGDKVSKADSFISLSEWAWEKLRGHITPLIGGGVMYYVAAITKWLSAAGPIVWGAIGLFSFIALQIANGLYVNWKASARLKRAQAEVAEITLSTATLNPLDTHFSRVRIRLSDLANPDGAAVSRRSFEDCQFVGPITILMSACNVDLRSSDGVAPFVHVEFVRVKREKLFAIPNKLILEHCQITRCRFFNVVVLVPEGDPAFDGAPVSWLN